MSPEEFRRFGHQLVDWIADYRARIAEFPVMAPPPPGGVRAQLPAAPPREGESWSAIWSDVEKIVLRGLTHWQHPRFFAFFPANSELASVLGDYLSTGLGVLGISWQACPALTELEEVVTDWMRQMIGLPASFRGVIQDTASTSTLIALLCARERATAFSMAGPGVQGQGQPLVIYASEQAHSSVRKAALLAGFGAQNLRWIETDGEFALRPDRLAASIEQDLAAGLRPCAVVATAGTTAATAFDPIGAIAALAARHGLWLHVDAAMAGSAMILPECRPLWQGVELADSLVVNPHKWLGAAFDCSLYYVRDPEHLIRVMSTNPSYLRSAADGEAVNYRDWGLALGRRFRALKLWFLLREQGMARLEARLRRDLANAQWLAAEARQSPPWRVVAPVPLQTVCLRHEPDGLAGEALDRHTLGWVERLNRSGFAYLTPAVLGGRWMARFSIGALATEREDVAAAWEAARAAAQAQLQSTAQRPSS